MTTLPESARAAESDFNKLDMPYESAQARVVVALAAMGLGHFDQAETNLTESREVFSRQRNGALTALIDAYLAELAIKSNRPDEAARSRGSQPARLHASKSSCEGGARGDCSAREPLTFRAT